MKQLIIEGWFFDNSKDKDVNLSRLIIPKSFIRSARNLTLSDLYVLDMDRIVGSFFAPIYVTGVIDTKGSLIPFFIHRQKALQLNNILKDRTSIL